MKKLTIINGIVQDKYINGIPIKIMIVKQHASKHGKVRTNWDMPANIVENVVIHNTGSARPTANAVNHARYCQTLEDLGDKDPVSYHFCVDAVQIVQIIPVNEATWQAGDGAGPGNTRSVSIEICENSDMSYKQSEKNGQVLAAALLATFQGTQLRKHQDFMRKDCPHKIVKSFDNPVDRWEQFKAETLAMVKTDTAGQPMPKPEPRPSVFYRVQVGAFNDKKNAEDLLEALTKLGYAPYVVEGHR